MDDKTFKIECKHCGHIVMTTKFFYPTFAGKKCSHCEKVILDKKGLYDFYIDQNDDAKDSIYFKDWMGPIVRKKLGLPEDFWSYM